MIVASVFRYVLREQYIRAAQCQKNLIREMRLQKKLLLPVKVAKRLFSSSACEKNIVLQYYKFSPELRIA